jgi:DNA-binding NtrC family response regulator/predicted TIM-barrel enzyme
MGQIGKREDASLASNSGARNDAGGGGAAARATTPLSANAPFMRHKTGSRDLIVGAAIGSGIMARAAARGGADFLVALNSARLRMMGSSSSLAKLPLRDNNALVGLFAREEILPQVDIPVFFGAAAFDPRSSIGDLVDSACESGFSGIANSRSVARYYGSFREAIEKAGFGIERECEMFSRAKAAGLSTLAFVRSLQDAETFAEVGVDIFCVQLAWSAVEFGESSTNDKNDRAMEVARSIISRIRPASSLLPCLVSGAPIVEPEEMLAVCDFARADGYIGGSSVDRLPSEGSVENRMADFKNVALLRSNTEESERRIRRANVRFGIVGGSPRMQAIGERVDRFMTSTGPMLITGEAGTGKSFLARSLHEHSPRGRREMATLNCDLEPVSLAIRLFGCSADTIPGVIKRQIGWLELLDGSSLIVDGVDRLSRDLQIRLAEAIETGRFLGIGMPRQESFDVRLIFTSRHSSGDLLKSGLIEETLYLKLKPYELNLPPLRERLEDIPALAELILRAIGGKGRRPVTRIDNSAVRALSAHDWPGNIRELISMLEEAVLLCRSDSVTAREIAMVRLSREQPVTPTRLMDEKSWILDALRKHRYRRGEAAYFLGISRKTLYLKMKRLGIEVGN